jgi:hypothetical protein
MDSILLLLLNIVMRWGLNLALKCLMKLLVGSNLKRHTILMLLIINTGWSHITRSLILLCPLNKNAQHVLNSTASSYVQAMSHSWLISILIRLRNYMTSNHCWLMTMKSIRNCWSLLSLQLLLILILLLLLLLRMILAICWIPTWYIDIINILLIVSLVCLLLRNLCHFWLSVLPLIVLVLLIWIHHWWNILVTKWALTVLLSHKLLLIHLLLKSDLILVTSCSRQLLFILIILCDNLIVICVTSWNIHLYSYYLIR